MYIVVFQCLNFDHLNFVLFFTVRNNLSFRVQLDDIRARGDIRIPKCYYGQDIPPSQDIFRVNVCTGENGKGKHRAYFLLAGQNTLVNQIRTFGPKR